MVERLGTRFGVDLGDPDAYAHWHTDNLRFGDLDPQGHVGHPTYGFLFQNARLAFWPAVGMAAQDATLGLVVVRTCIEHLAPLLYPGTARTGTRVLALGRSSVTSGSGMFDQTGVCVATSEVVSVRIDPATGKPEPWDDALRALLAPAG